MSNTDLNIFKTLLGYSESGGNYNNDLNQYWGKYQFGNARRLDISRALNIPTPTRAQFTPELQERFFAKHVELLEKQINNELNRFVGTQVKGKRNGITATVNIFGLIAGAHLAGYEGLKKYLFNPLTKDVNDDYTKNGKKVIGNYISDYVAKFSYQMEVKKKSKV